MAENGSGGVGVLGVLVGAMLVVMVGIGVLFATGHLGGGGSEHGVHRRSKCRRPPAAPRDNGKCPESAKPAGNPAGFVV